MLKNPNAEQKIQHHRLKALATNPIVTASFG
jgi:hypothetical protein